MTNLSGTAEQSTAQVSLATDAEMRAQDRTLSHLGVWAACFIYLVGYPGLYFDEPLAQARYLVYAAPLALIAPLFLAHRPKTSRPAALLFTAYLCSGLPNFLLGGRTESFTVNFVIIALVLLSFVPVLTVSERQVRTVFYVTFLYSMTSFLLTSQGSARIFLLLASGTGTGLVDAYDSHEGLLAPIYALFFFAAGTIKPFVMAIVMTVLGGKRIGLLALVAGLLVLAIYRRSRLFGTERRRFITLLAALAVINVTGLNIIAFAESAYEALDIRVHIEEVMLGRHQIGVELTRLIAEKPMGEWLLGSGPGAADIVAGTKVKGATGELPHNDWLKIFYDYGLAGSVAVTVFLARMFSASPAGAAMAIATAIMMITDNVLIYVFYQIPLILMASAAAAISNGKERPQGRTE
ncbi:MAG: hypothetical protein ACRCS9_02115 [Hyphomicrobium sp.]